MFRHFGLLALNYFKIIPLSTLLHLSVPREVYYRNVSCAEHYLSISCVKILLIYSLDMNMLALSMLY